MVGSILITRIFEHLAKLLFINHCYCLVKQQLKKVNRQEKNENKKMIFQLFLLVSPAFGMPSSALLDAGSQIIGKLDSLPGFAQEGKDILKNQCLSR